MNLNFYKKYNKAQRRGLLIVLSVCVMPSISVAQQYYDPGLLQKTVDRKPVEYQTPGVRMGSFLLRPGAELAYESNNNIYYSSSADKNISDSVVHIRPWVNMISDWGRHSIELNAFVDLARYSDYSTENYEDMVFTLDGRVDVRHRSNFNYKATYMQLHEDRASPDDVFGVVPTEFTYSGGEIGYSHAFNRLTADISYRAINTDYSNNMNAQGDILDNQDRDRKQNTVALKGTYELSPQRSAFVSFSGNSVDYDHKFDSAGFQRSSDGHNIRGGVGWRLTGVVTGDLYGQYMEQDYDDVRLGSISGFGVGGSLDWTPSLLTNVHFRFANSPQETTRVDTSGFNSRLYSVRVQHEFRRDLLANVRFAYTDNDYEYSGTNINALTETQVVRAGFGINYLVNRNVSLNGGYIYEDQAANINNAEYSTNRWFLTLVLDM